MDSTTLYTEEIDDLEQAAAELLAQARPFPLKKNSLAIIFTDEDTDTEQLYARLSKSWGFPIMGCTALAMFLGKEGYRDIGISVLLLTADDCQFAVGMTGDLDKDNYRGEVASCYRALAASLPSKEKLVISYGGIVTGERSIGGDDIVDMLGELGGGVPVYGGTASDSYSFKNIRLHCNGRTAQSAQVIALISGNLSPRFVCVNSIENKRDFAYEVTEAEGNQVRRLGDESFVGVLERENMTTGKTNVMADYLLSPFVMTVRKEGGDSVEVSRTLSLLNEETGSGSFLGSVPQGSVLGIGIISRADVQQSIGVLRDGILEELGREGNGIRTLLCTSCCARFLALAGNTAAETDSFKGALPGPVSLIGFYSYGEYCPVVGNATGRQHNMFHNFTFTVLAF